MAIQHPGSATSKPANLILTIIWTWFLVGTLDGCGATINYLVQGGKDATLIFRYIASAVFGIEAYSGGTGMVLMGILFHYINALSN